MVVHGHEVDEQAEAEGAEPDAEAAHGLRKPGPGLALQRHEPRRADPRGDDREHHARLRRVFRGIEVGQAGELLQLLGVEVGEGQIAEHALKEAVDHEDHDAHGNQREHEALLERMGGTHPVALEGPEVEDVGHPDEDDQPPAAVVVAHIGRVETHDPARVLKNPPRYREDQQGEEQIGQRGPRAAPLFDELALLKIGNPLFRHMFPPQENMVPAHCGGAFIRCARPPRERGHTWLS